MSEATPAPVDGDIQAVFDPEFNLEIVPPVVFKGATFDVLRLKEPRALQVRDAEQKIDATMSESSVTDYQIELVRLVAKVPEPVVAALPSRQLAVAYNYLADFIDAPGEDVVADGLDLPDACEMPLDPPLAWNGALVHSLTLREPTADQLRKARAFMRSGVTVYTHRCYHMHLLESVAGVSAAVVHGLRIRDLTRASRHLERFIAAGRRTGKR